MIDLIEIENQLAAIKRTDDKPLFKKVATALDPESVIDEGSVRYDSAFVIPLRDGATTGERTTGSYSQQLQSQFAVMIGVRAINDRLGKNVNQRLRNAILATRKALTGYQPQDQNLDPIEFIEGEIVAFLKGGAFWMEQFKTSYIYEQE